MSSREKVTVLTLYTVLSKVFNKFYMEFTRDGDCSYVKVFTPVEEARFEEAVQVKVCGEEVEVRHREVDERVVNVVNTFKTLLNTALNLVK